MDMSKVLVVVKFGGGIDFLSWDIDFFEHMGIFWTCDLGHGNFLDMWFWSWEFFFFWTCGFQHGKIFCHGKFLIMWKL